jgi:hypothetical protein
MYLLEEYYLRHSIIDVPVVNYSRRTLTYLYDKAQRPPIRLISIWTDDSDAGPPTFVLDYCTPHHNSYKSGLGGYRNLSRYMHVPKRMRLEWDEYEAFLLSWIGQLPKEVVALDQHQGAVMAFAVCYDHWISTNARQSVKDSLAILIDPETDQRVRRCAWGTFSKFLRQHPTPAGAYDEAFCDERSYGHWLMRLVNSRKEPWFVEYCEKQLGRRTSGWLQSRVARTSRAGITSYLV